MEKVKAKKLNGSMQVWTYRVGIETEQEICERKYWLGVIYMVIPAGKYIILDCPGQNELIERIWYKEDIIFALWDRFFPIGTILYNQKEGVLVKIQGDLGERHYVRPMLPENLEGRAKRLYDYWSINLVPSEKI